MCYALRPDSSWYNITVVQGQRRAILVAEYSFLSGNKCLSSYGQASFNETATN